MNKTTRTAVGALLQTAQKYDLPYTYVANSVMNKQLSILPDNLPTETPYSKYVGIGIGGLTPRYFDNNTRAELWPQPHDPRHTGFYKQVPFVIRPVSDDLDVTERARFRLRRLIPIDNITYAAYYLRPLNLTNTTASLEYRQVVDGQITSKPWEPSEADQHPVPTPVNPGQVLVTGDDYVASTAKTAFVFTPWDISELINVGNVLFKSENSILISELGICSGTDFESRGDFNGIMLPYTEAVGVQITDFVSVMIPSSYMRAGATVNMDTGSVEPLLALRRSQ